jgi:hypothetical protein
MRMSSPEMITNREMLYFVSIRTRTTSDASTQPCQINGCSSNTNVVRIDADSGRKNRFHRFSTAVVVAAALLALITNIISPHPHEIGSNRNNKRHTGC